MQNFDHTSVLPMLFGAFVLLILFLIDREAHLR